MYNLKMKYKFTFIQLTAASFVIAFLFLAFLELIFFFFYPKSSDRLLDILRIIEQDSVLIWKQKPYLDTEFQNQAVKTNSIGFRSDEIKEKDKIRIISLGASPTFGWGVRSEDTYPSVVGKELKKHNIDSESINAGEIGYSSYQGLLLLKNTVLNLKPDIITVSFVINDIDKYRFFRSNSMRDSRLKPFPEAFVTVSNIMHKSSLFRAFYDMTSKFMSKKSKYYGKSFNNAYNENRRVSVEEYEYNLNAIADIAQKNGIKIVFVVMPVNLPEKKTLLPSEKEYLKNAVAEAEKEIKNKDYKRAKRILDRLLYIDEYSPKVYYYLGIIADIEHKSKLADEMFEKAKNYEIFDCAAVSRQYNEIMRKVSLERNIPLCDSEKDFNEYKNGYLFVDPKKDCFHPNAEGHKLIAGRLSAVLLDNFFKDKGKI